MEDTIWLESVVFGQLVWECEQGQDALLFIVKSANKSPEGWDADAIDVVTQKHVHLFEAHRSAYGPKLYTKPQYTKPDYKELMRKVADVFPLVYQWIV